MLSRCLIQHGGNAGSSKSAAAEGPASTKAAGQKVSQSRLATRLGKRSTTAARSRLRRSKLGVAGAIRLQLSFHPVSSTPQPYRWEQPRQSDHIGHDLVSLNMLERFLSFHSSLTLECGFLAFQTLFGMSWTNLFWFRYYFNCARVGTLRSQS